MRHLLLSLAALLPLGCSYPETIDEDVVCVSIQALGGDQYRLLVEAQSGDHCAADHKGASLECTITVDDQLAHIETVFQDGKDPNDACAGPLETSCSVDVEAATYTLEYAGDQIGYFVPGGERVCIGGAWNDETGG